MHPPSCDQHDCSPLQLTTKYPEYWGNVAKFRWRLHPAPAKLVCWCRRATMTTRRRTGRRPTRSWRGACRSPSGQCSCAGVGFSKFYIVKLHQKSSHMAYMSASGWPPSSPPTSPPSLLKTSTPTTKIKR